MNDTKSVGFFKLLFFPPKQDVLYIVVEKKNRVVVLIPIIFGIMIGVFRAFPDYNPENLEYWLGQLFGNILVSTLFTLAGVFLYVLLILFFSNILKGIANFKMTFTLFSYSLIPVIIGWLIITSISLIIRVFNIDFINPNVIIEVMNTIQRIFILYGIIILVRGVAMINQFSIFKALISSVGIIIVLLIYGIFKQIV
jgi:hypothetical protein